jgi:hypothetical protein
LGCRKDRTDLKHLSNKGQELIPRKGMALSYGKSTLRQECLPVVTRGRLTIPRCHQLDYTVIRTVK